MDRGLHDWLSCPACESGAISVLAYDTTLSLQCYECGTTGEFEVGEPPLYEFGTVSDAGE